MTTAVVGVAAASASPVHQPAAGAARLEALVIDQLPTVPPASPAPTALPPKPLPRSGRLPVAKRPPVKSPVVKRSVVHRPTTKRPARSLAGRHSTSLGQAVARIPGYAAHRPTRWVLTSRYGHYGATDLGNGIVYINPSVPASRLDSVVRHEWAHVLQIRVYGSAPATMEGLDAYFGGSGIAGAERAADCMALQLGATWTNYTSCSSPAWQRGAAALLAGRRP